MRSFASTSALAKRMRPLGGSPGVALLARRGDSAAPLLRLGSAFRAASSTAPASVSAAASAPAAAASASASAAAPGGDGPTIRGRIAELQHLSVEEQLKVLNSEVESLQHDPSAVIQWANETFGGRVAMSTSFGIQSAVLLHLATTAKPDIPVVWVDTGYLPAETYQYAQVLADTLDIKLSVWGNREWSPARMEALYGKLWEKDDVESHTLYGNIRKVVPMNDGLDALEPNPLALFSGLRASQTKARANMPVVGHQNGRFKVLPMLRMSDADVAAYMDTYDLPQHPLQAQGYVTVGDWHSSRPVGDDEDARATRFGGKFEECGLHVESHSPESSDAAAPVPTPTLTPAKPAEPQASDPVPPSAVKTGLAALAHTVVHPDIDHAVIMVKKIMEDGSYCRKCNDVAGKMDADGITEWVGHTAFADVRDLESEGAVMARHFGVATAPFFLLRTKEESDTGAEWRVVRSYLQLRKQLQTAAEEVEERKQKLKDDTESGHIALEETAEYKDALKQMEDLRARVAMLTAQLDSSEKAVEETRRYFVDKFADVTDSSTLFKEEEKKKATSPLSV